MSKILGHLYTISKHKLLVGKLCFKCHLYKRGLLHDLSKYSYIELKTGFKYYQNGKRSPIDAEKEEKGYSLGWMHHKGLNKHHWEYWLDSSNEGIIPIEMPKEYVIEMFCDCVAASMIYQKDKYKDDSALIYYENGTHRRLIHPNTDKLIRHLFTYLKDNGLDMTIDYIKKEIR